MMSSFLRKRQFLLVIVVFLAAFGFWYYYNQYLPAGASSPAEEIKTARVRRGDLVITASGSGKLVPAAEVNLGFSSGGLLSEMLVKVGDRVKAGQVLARLDDSEAQAEVAQAKIELRLAELELAELKNAPDPKDVAAAQADLLSAQEELASLLAKPSQEEIDAAKADLKLAEIDLQQAQADYDKIAWRAGAQATSQAVALWQATTNYEKAKANYELAVAGPTKEEIAAARAKVAAARAQLEALLKGSSAEEIESAELKVEQARLTLQTAQTKLEKTVLKAPFAGTVTAVEANAGEMVGTEPIITLADLTHPLVEIYLDETELSKVAVGNEVEVTFDAFPEETFTGRVVRVDPELVEMEDVPTVQALAALDEKQADSSKTLPLGLSASVEVIAGRARNALLVPVEALRELSPGKYAVFVLADGKLQVRTVEVGLMDYAYAEIISGLKEGEEVSTGVVEKK